MRAIYRREVQSYFQTMVGYAFAVFLIAAVGVYFVVYNLSYGYPKFAYSLYGSMYFFLLAVPVLTMRSLAEERKNRTDQLLLTRPVSLWQIVMGKYLAMVSVLAIPCGVFVLFPMVIQGQGTAYLKTDYLSLLIYFLLGCTYISMGLFFSSLTESPVIAAVATFGALLVCYLWEGLKQFVPSSAIAGLSVLMALIAAAGFWIWRTTGNWLLGTAAGIAGAAICVGFFLADGASFENLLPGIMGHFAFASLLEDAMYNNLFDVQGILLLLSVTALCLFLTAQMIQKRRWS